jgi:hypothetical protein
MSQVFVERVIGLLATDEGLRSSFEKDPAAVIEAMVEKGMELTECERWALSRVDPRELKRFAQAVDPRLQKCDLKGMRAMHYGDRDRLPGGGL